MKHLFQGTVNLPGSKSESNRALMIAAYGGFPLLVENLSEAHDTLLLKDLLEQVALQSGSSKPFVVDGEDAGTVSRFMLTYLADKQGEWVLTGSDRMRQRPMVPLVEALRQLGADIEFLGKEGFLPVRIMGGKMLGGKVAIDASQSSQFASSLMLAAPMWHQGIDLELVGKLTSLPYIDMTLAMMRHFGADAVRNGRNVVVRPKPYQDRRFSVSADWSAASYWYEMMAVGDGGSLVLKGLKKDSLQGDAVVAEWFKQFGVTTAFEEQGVRLTKNDGAFASDIQPLSFDFTNVPDLFPSVLVTCVMLHYQARFQGISNLSMKESNRVDSLISELSKYYTFINILMDDEIVIGKSLFRESFVNNNKVLFNTYHDHRVAMALAPLFLRMNHVAFDDASVVTKSYPTFWDDVAKNHIIL